MRISTCVSRLPRLGAGLFLFACAAPGPAMGQEDGPAPASIHVNARKNPGNNLSYRFCFDTQKSLLAYLPAQPRLVDVMYRVSFTEMPLAERDAYEPKDWGVSVVSDSVDEAIAVRRGGYFWLPELPLAYKEKATLMFKEQSRKNILDVGWILRIGPQQRLGYAEFARAMAEIRTVQKAIPFYKLSLRTEKHAAYDGIKACFLDGGGALLVDGKPGADAVIGNCSVLKFDPARAAGAQVIELKGALDLVTIVETAPYMAAQAAQAAQAARATSSAGSL